MSLEEPKPKKARTNHEEDEEWADAPNVAHDTQTGDSIQAQRNDDGEAFFDLSSKRRITIRKYQGKTLVDIREVGHHGARLSTRL